MIIKVLKINYLLKKLVQLLFIFQIKIINCSNLNANDSSNLQMISQLNLNHFNMSFICLDNFFR